MNSDVPKKKKSRAMLSADRQTVVLRIGAWSEKFDVAKLQGRISLYSDLEARKDRQYAIHYTDTKNALLAVRKRLRGSEEVKS